MMLAMLIESALRSLVVAAGVWLFLAMLRIRNPHLLRSSWIAVLAVSLSMPLLMQSVTVALPTDTLPIVWGAPQFVAATTASSDWQTTVLNIYWLICAAFLMRLSVGLFQTWRISRRALPVTEQWDVCADIRTTTRILSPVTFASIILLPNEWTSWSVAKREAVLAHECSHVRQRDFYVLLLAQVHRAVFWFNPLAWWLPKKLGQLSEVISDDAAVRSIVDRSLYAHILLEFAYSGRRVPSALPMAQQSTVLARIECLLNEAESFTKPNWRTHISIAMGIAPLVLFAACSSTVERPLPTLSAQEAKPVQVVIRPQYDSSLPTPWPQYPPQSLRSGEEGTAFVDLQVGTDGRVLDARLRKSSGFAALDEASLAVARTRWQLKPGTVNGAPKEMWVTVPFVFKMQKIAPKAEPGEIPL